MNNKFSKNELLEMIDSKLTNLTEEEILELINNELSKDNEQVDMSYVDTCYDLLEIKRSGVVYTTKPKIKKPIKVLLIAAAFVVITVSSVTVSAQLNLNIPQKIAQLINGNAKIDYNLENADTTADGYALLDTDLAKRLAEYDVYPITFPEAITKENCIINNIEDLTEDVSIFTCINIEFKYDDFFGKMLISKYAKEKIWAGNTTDMNVVSGQMINVNGLDVLVFEHNNYCIVLYKDKNTEYSLYIETDIDTAIKIVNTIK